MEQIIKRIIEICETTNKGVQNPLLEIKKLAHKGLLILQEQSSDGEAKQNANAKDYDAAIQQLQKGHNVNNEKISVANAEYEKNLGLNPFNI